MCGGGGSGGNPQPINPTVAAPPPPIPASTAAGRLEDAENTTGLDENGFPLTTRQRRGVRRRPVDVGSGLGDSTGSSGSGLKM